MLEDRVRLEGYTESAIVLGENLMNLEYEPLFNPHDFGVQRLDLPSLRVEGTREDLTYPVIGDDFVSLDEGTGIVHIAPAFGEIDFEAGDPKHLFFVQPVDEQGNMRWDKRK